MGFIGDMFSSSNGAGFKGTGAHIMNPITSDEASGTVGQSNAAIQQQQAQLAQQQALINSLQGAANGQGPTAAQAQQQQGTDQAVKQAATTIASARGVNPGTAARLAGQQQAATAQGAVNNAAQLRAQEQQAARGELGSNINALIGNQAGVTNATLQEQQNLFNQISNQNNANVSMQSNINNVNAGIARGNQGSQAGLTSSLSSGLGSVATLFAHGGKVPSYADGGSVPSLSPSSPTSGPTSAVGKFMKGFGSNSASQSSPVNSADSSDQSMYKDGQGIGKGLGNIAKGIGGLFASDAPQATPMPQGMTASPMMVAKGGKVPAMVSPGEKYLPPKKAQEVAKASNKEEAIKKKAETIPGKAKVKGDDLKNDTVPKTLESGGVVIPRTKAQDPKKAADFVSAVMGHKGLQAKRKKK